MLPLPIALFLIFPSIATTQCFFPNSTLDPSPLYKPCKSDRPSMCCRTEDDNPDHCLPNGLCQNPFWNDSIWRESCTDPTWQDEGCLKICIDGIVRTQTGVEQMKDSHVLLTTCDNGSFCCGVEQDARECCRSGEGKFIVDGKVVDSTSTSSVLMSSTSSVSVSASASASASPSASSSPNVEEGSSNTGTIVGAVVGGVAGLAGLGAMIWILAKRRRSAGVAELELQGDKGYYRYEYREVEGEGSGQVVAPVELAGNMGSEMPANEVYRELPS